jgi:hypothetical protein
VNLLKSSIKETYYLNLPTEEGAGPHTPENTRSNEALDTLTDRGKGN